MNGIKIRSLLINALKLRKVQYRKVSHLQQTISSSYYFKPGDILLTSNTAGKVLNDTADRDGDKKAVISAYQNIVKSYTEFRDEADKLASGFLSLGLERGNSIAIFSPNSYEWLLTQYAAAKAGLILVTINPAFQPKELEYCLRKARCKAVVCWDVLKTQDYYKILCEVAPELHNHSGGKLKSKNLPNLEYVIMISEQEKKGTLKFKDVFNCRNRESDEKFSIVEKSIQFDDPINILFTSGTTGVPKGATLSHHNIVNNAKIGGQQLGYNLMRPTVCCQLPLFHVFGCVQASLTTVTYQGTIVIPSAGFDSISSLKAIEHHKCSTIFGTPTMYVDLINNYKMQKISISPLKQAIIGGASCPETLLEDIKRDLGVPYMHVGYGATETSPAVVMTGINDDFDVIKKQWMPPLEYVEVKVIDTKGNVVPVEAQGEVCVRGHNVFMGYFEEEEKTAEVLSKTGWYHTGDLAVMDKHGRIKIVGRIKDMIIRGGENIYPAEIENLIDSHPAVLEAHLCGVPDKRMGEEVCAWISLKNSMKVTEEEIKEFCKGKISHFKIPRYIMFVEEFPKTQSGKVKKFEMQKITIDKLQLKEK